MTNGDILNKLRSDIRDQADLLARLEKIQAKFPDLQVDKDRCYKERYYTKSANELVDRVDFGHSCGCCPGALLYVMPYFVYEGIPIYSDPVHIVIGKRGWIGGESPHKDWLDNLKQYNLPQTIIDQVQKFFDESPPTDFDKDSEAINNA